VIEENRRRKLILPTLLSDKEVMVKMIFRNIQVQCRSLFVRSSLRRTNCLHSGQKVVRIYVSDVLHVICDPVYNCIIILYFHRLKSLDASLSSAQYLKDNDQ
jgi:hypothetical protein